MATTETPAAETTFHLTDLTPEILHNLFFFLSSTDLARLSRTCHYLRDFIGHDELLWKRIYLVDFDIPLHSPTSWPQSLQDLTQLRSILRSNDHDLKRQKWPFLASRVLPLLMGTSSEQPRNAKTLAGYFHHSTRQSNASTLLRQSSLFKRCGTPYDQPADTIALRQLSARLHVYSALPLEIRETEYLDMPGTNYLHPYARSRLYDLRRYKAENFWGPFMDDGSGRVDWEKVQAIYIVLGYGLRMLSERTGGSISSGIGWGMGLNGGSDDEMFQGLATGSYRSMSTKDVDRDPDTQSSTATAGSDESEENLGVPSLDWFYDRYDDRREAEFQHKQAVFATQDPYGVKGTWMRIVNFLDYHDLFAFNFSANQPHPNEERDPVTTAEAFRLILLKLWVTKIEWPDEDEVQPEDWETVGESEAATSSREQSEAPESPSSSREQSVEIPQSPEAEMCDASDADLLTSNTTKREEVGPSDADILSSNKVGEEMESTAVHHNISSIKSLIEQPIEGETTTPRPGTPAPKKKSKYPIVHFEGRSRSLHIRWDPNANSHIRGSNPFYYVIGQVRAYPAPAVPKHELQPEEERISGLRHVYMNQTAKTPYSRAEKVSSEEVTGLKPEDDLVIRWTTWSVFHGEERWRSEGVQIGGLKSARGILGNWFDKDFDPHGPAGPTGFWKMGDGVEMYPNRRAQQHHPFGDDSD